MQIKQNANRAANLVRQLLAFSRKQVLKPKLIDLTDVLSELSNLLRRLLGEKVNLQVKHGRDLAKVLADQGQIDQVIINLAVNARDAMPAGGNLTIETSNVEVTSPASITDEFYSPDPEDKIVAGEYVLISVIDTGTGMSKELVGKIFEPFFSTKEVGAGTGLGLATVYGIVKQSGGYILVKSVEGQGTEFRIYIKKADENALTQDVEEEAKKTLSQDLTGTGTILIVEDEVPVRIFASRALANKGYKIIEADGPEVALELVKEHGGSIDLILSDVIMPGMNGPTMVKEIKQAHPSVKVIFMSGYTQDALDDYDVPPEDLHFLQKPFTLKDLAAKVKQVMGE
jgi:two-component system cell cycle sensor histidine kinase/response regulator CckA